MKKKPESKPCECQKAGWCERHQVLKPQGWVRLCQVNNDYRSAWDEGRGPGQLLPGSFSIPVRPPGPGTELKKLLGCCSFPYLRQLNEWGPDECLVHLEEIVSMLIKNSCKNKDGLTERSARRLVQLAIERARRNEATLAAGIDG